ncbi:MAG: sodium/proline symporter PutP [Treponema sp.]|nr:sodium/proline symporter PutP [Spirochaetia bacterium]MDD7460345.1 sodium/proline symporter PutP [Spirochaetales bacterium]MDY5812575.1 sodium/proline symporter PutP [Treponema sp.]
MTLQTIGKICAFALYLGFMVYIGFRSSKKTNNAKDFFLGGRGIGPWVTALSAEASDSSAWLLMGLPGLCYLGGLKETFWTALGLIVGTYLNWLLVAKPLRKCSIAYGDSITIPGFFKNRFKSERCNIISVILIVFFFTIYTASGIVACGKLFRSVFGLNYTVGMVIGLIVILSYTILGGYRAVCTTDFVQGALIFIAFVVAGTVAIFALGGPASAIESAKDFSVKALSGEFNEDIKKAFVANQSFSAKSAISAFSWCLGYFGMPHIIIRFMGIRSNEEIKTARRVGIIWMIIAYIGAFIIGSLGTVYLLPNLLDAGTSETVFSETMLKMFPSFIAGIFLCAILAASMSTADSQLLAVASTVSLDLYKAKINKNADEKKVLLVSRITVFAVAIVAFGLCLLPNNNSIFGLVSYAWAGFGATFGAIIFLALFWKKCTADGASLGLLVGFITVVVWHNLHGGIFDIYEILPGFIATLVVAVIVSLFTKTKEGVEEKFVEYKNMAD